MITSREDFEARAARGGSFDGETIEGIDLSGFEGENLDFSASKWTNVRAAGAKLRGALFARATLTFVDLRDADLAGSIWNGADASSPAGAPRNDLSGAKLDDALLANARFDRAALTGARLDDVVATGASFADAQAERATFQRALMSGCSFDGATMAGAVFDGAVLAEAKMERAVLTGASFYEVDLTETDLAGATMAGARLCRTTLPNADFRSLGEPADLTEADMPAARFAPATALGQAQQIQAGGRGQRRECAIGTGEQRRDQCQDEDQLHQRRQVAHHHGSVMTCS